MDDIIPDSALSALDRRIIKLDSQIKEIADIENAYSTSKADNIEYDAGAQTLQLLSGAKEIGDKVYLNVSGDNGVPAVDFSGLVVGEGVSKLLAGYDQVVSI